MTTAWERHEAGRFAHLLDDADRAWLAATYTTESGKSVRDEVVAVQLSYPPRRPHNENVVRVPPLLPDIVSLSEHPDSTHSERSVSSWLFLVLGFKW